MEHLINEIFKASTTKSTVINLILAIFR